MESLGCMTWGGGRGVFLVKATGVLNGTFDISSCLTRGRKCSSKKTVQTLCAVFCGSAVVSQ